MSDSPERNDPVNPHVFHTEPYGRFFRSFRWCCSCGASQGGFIMRTSAVFYGDNNAMQPDQQ